MRLAWTDGQTPLDFSQKSLDRTRPFLILEGRGVVVGNTMTPAERAMISGLAQVVQRIVASAPLRYLTRAEVAGSSSMVANRYRELANARGKSAA